MYCLDTNIVIDLFRGEEDTIAKIDTIRDKVIFITTITLCELFKGAYQSSRKRDLYVIKNFASSNEIITLCVDSCEIFGEVYLELKKKGKLIPEPDLMIASIAKQNNLTLITRDKNHFKNIPNLSLEIW